MFADRDMGERRSSQDRVVTVINEPGSSSMETSKSAENTASKQRGRPFEPGKSGNPNGRPKGARNHATLLAEALLDGEADAITRKLIEKALDGDGAALRLCLDRLLPPRRGRTVKFQLPEKIETAADAARASSSVLSAVSEGHLSLDEASTVMGLISSHARLVEITDLATRLAALEEAQKP